MVRKAFLKVFIVTISLTGPFVGLAVPNPTNVTDSLALVDIYQQMNGHLWSWKWDFSKPVTEWRGVSCTPAYTPGTEHRVISIGLSNNNVSGTIPTSIGNLSELQFLSLWRNQVQGTIPPSIGLLSNLEGLDLADNLLTGSIPAALNGLVKVKNMWFSRNKLSGAIPALPSLSALIYVGFEGNQFRYDGMEEFMQAHPTGVGIGLWPQSPLVPNKNQGRLSVYAGGTLQNNVYIWKNRDTHQETRITGDSTFIPTSGGQYTVQVENAIVQNRLVLTSDPFMVRKPNFRAINPNPTFIRSGNSIEPNIYNVFNPGNVNGVATDGLSRVLFIGNSDVPITVSISGAWDGEMSTMEQQTVRSTSLQLQPVNGKIAFVYYAPDGYGNYNAGGGREIRINSSNGVGDTAIYALRLYTPPVVLVHGMWSSPDAWGTFANGLRSRGFYNIVAADYSDYSHLTFDPESDESLPGRNAVKTAIDLSLQFYELGGVVATQVDVVGHSLGGLMARSFSQWNSQNVRLANYEKGYVHKLITLGTPHIGSPLGPLLYHGVQIGRQYVDNRTSGNPFLYVSQKMLLDYVFSGRVGSVHRDFNTDVSTNHALQHLKNTVDANIAKVHAVVGIAGSSNPARGAWDRFLSLLFGTPLSTLFQLDQHDFIVGKKSQTGGLASAVTEFGSTAHSNPPGFEFLGFATETTNPAIIQHVGNLLLSANPSDFAAGFPSPTAANQRLAISTQSITPAHFQIADTGYIKLTSTSKNIIVDSTATDITISFDTLARAQLDGPAICLLESGGSFQFPAQTRNLITIPVTNIKSASTNFFVLVKNSFGTLMIDSSTIRLKPRGAFLKLELGSDTIRLDSFRRDYRFNPIALYLRGNDTLSYLADSTMGISYQALNTTVSVNGQGYVRPLFSGYSSIRVTLKNAAGIPQFVKDVVFDVAQWPGSFVKRTAIINFAPGNKAILDPPFALNANTNSGEKIKYTLLSGPAILDNDVITLTGTGTITIKATSDENMYFTNASKTVSFNVTANYLPQYIFIGNGNWSDAQNWSNNTPPPAEVPAGVRILISPAGNGECILNVPVKISSGAVLEVQAGKKLKMVNMMGD